MDKMRLAVHFGSRGVLVLRVSAAFFFSRVPCASFASLRFPCAPSGLRLLLLPPLRPPPSGVPSPSSSAPASSSVIKRGYFSVGLLKLTFLRPGETLVYRAISSRKAQKSTTFLSSPVNPPRRRPATPTARHLPPPFAALTVSPWFLCRESWRPCCSLRRRLPLL